MFFLFVGYSSLLTIYISCTIAALLTGRKLWQNQAQGGAPICWNWLGVRGKEENGGDMKKDPLSYSFRFQLTNHHKSPNHNFNPLQTVSSLLQNCLLFNWYPSHPPLSKIELACLVLLLLPLDLFYSFSTLILSPVTREEMQRTDLCLFFNSAIEWFCDQFLTNVLSILSVLIPGSLQRSRRGLGTALALSWIDVMSSDLLHAPRGGPESATWTRASET